MQAKIKSSQGRRVGISLAPTANTIEGAGSGMTLVNADKIIEAFQERK